MIQQDDSQANSALEGNRFGALQIKDWKQLENVDIEFHKQLTIITGANGSGKTTILNFLSRHFGWSNNEIATPKRNKTGKLNYSARNRNIESLSDRDITFGTEIVGSISYIDNENTFLSDISVPLDLTVQYYLSISQQQYVNGLNIPSHRSVYSYHPVNSISTQKRLKADAYQLTRQSIINRFQNQGGPPPSYFIKETLISWAFIGGGSEFVEADLDSKNLFLGFQRVLKKVLPKNIGFSELAIRKYEVVLITESGEFIIDSASGGISAIIDLAWQIYNFSVEKDRQVVVVIDEVENHLHATMQRSILPNLIEAFPNIQLIVSTHSPLIVGSVKDSNVYALRYNKNKRVYSDKLDLENKVKTASEILGEVLGVPFTMPIWVEKSLEKIVDKYVARDVNPDIFREMRSELIQLGMEELMPIAIDNYLKIKND